MKQFGLVVILFLSTFGSNAQTELTIPWQDSQSVRGITHNLDDDGNTYILSTLCSFSIGPGIAIEGETTYGSVITKIDKNNNLLWKQYYSIASLVGLGSLTAGLLPAFQLYVNDNTVFIPFNIYDGLQVCRKDSTGTSAAFSNKNGGLVVDATTGNILQNTIFNEGPSCGSLNLINTCINKNKTISYLYSGPAQDTLFVNVRDSNLNFLALNSYPHLTFPNLIYDSIAEQYIIGNNDSIYIYDKDWRLSAAFVLPFADSILGYTNFTFSYNDNYYVINYYNSIFRPNHFSYTAVFSKNGNIISSQKSPLYADFFLTKQNELFGISTVDFSLLSDTIGKPVTLYQMDLYQNVKRQKTFGKPYVIANKISVTNNNEIIVTGTSQTSNPNKFPNQQPDGIYYYKEVLSNIPLLINNNSFCSSINAYPNPTKKSINITSSDFDFTYNSTVELSDLLGQKLSTSVFDTKTLSLDLTYYPSGTYFLKTRNSSASCVSKIQKE